MSINANYLYQSEKLRFSCSQCESCIGWLLAVLMAFFAAPMVTIAGVDIVFHHGKIVTVDGRFRVVEALAIEGERIVAVGSNKDVLKLAGPQTERVDLKGRTVIPGLMDNHAHFARGSQHWLLEVRWDGVTSRAQAVSMLRERVSKVKPGQWIAVLGGWSYDQFTDSQAPFTKAELDGIAPQNPLALQLIYVNGVVNTEAVKALGLNQTQAAIAGVKVQRDEKAEATGLIEGGGVASFYRNRIPMGDLNAQIENVRAHLQALNAMGLTTSTDWGGYGFSEQWYEPFQMLEKRHELSMRVFHGTWYNTNSAQDVAITVEKIQDLKPFQGSDYMDRIGFGETVLLGLHDNPGVASSVSSENLALWGKVVQAVAQRSMSFSVHANQRETIQSFLGEIERINQVKPIRPLRWSFAHVRQLKSEDFVRMRALGMGALVHSQANISGVMLQKVYGNDALDQPPLRLIQNSGLAWGLGSDSNGAAPSNPFYTLGWAVTGKMLGGKRVLRQTITREEALIAHTRSNAYFVFRESYLGSLEPGKYADLLVLDRDYLSIPADDIMKIKPLMTMVGGKRVFQSPLLH